MPKEQNAPRLTIFLCLMAILPLLAQIEEIPAKKECEQRESAVQVKDRTELIVLGKPSFRTSYEAARFSGDIDSVRLILVARIKNLITDEKEWFENNRLSLPVITGSEIADHNVAESYQGTGLLKVIQQLNNVLAIYGQDYTSGRYLVVYECATSQIKVALDFEDYLYPPEYIPADFDFIGEGIRWALEENDVLYVCHSHNTYAASSKGMNAYITAIDLKTNKVLWRTKPLVCNANNFELVGDVIISGYGFTAEPDFLYLINKYSGEVIKKIKVPSGPEYIIRKDNKLYARTYDTNLIFRIQQEN